MMFALATQVVENIPTPGMVTVSLRLAASIGAAVACGLLLLLWAYRRRVFILLWAAGWGCAAASLFLIAGADTTGRLSSVRIMLSGFIAVTCTGLLLAGIRRYRGATDWRTWILMVTATLAAYGVASRWLGSLPVFVATFAGMAVIVAATAWHVGTVARHQRMVGAVMMAGALFVIAVLNVSVAFAAALISVDLNLARAVLLVNASSYSLVVFGQHLFVFEDMLLDLRASNQELTAARAELRHAAITDALTGLYNRRLFDEVSAHQLEHHRRFHLPLSLVYIDVDRFKAVNDTHGHDVGDRVLQHVARYIGRHTREADYLFRLGGDEFLLMMSCGGDEAARKAADLQRGFRPTLLAAGLPDIVALSAGVAEVSVDARDLVDALQQVDARMYENKRLRAGAPSGG